MRFFQIILLTIFCYSANAQTVYKTPYGEKYHLENCRMVNNVSRSLTISEAIDIGLDPCKICKPPSLQTPNDKSPKNLNGQSSTVQCKGTTKAGNRCKHMTSIANGYCFQHNPNKN